MKKSLLTMAAALALVSCSQDDLMQGIENRPTGAIGVKAYVPTITRGTALNNEGELVKAENGFDLFAFLSDKNQFMGNASDGVAFQGSGTDTYVWNYVSDNEMKFWSEAEDKGITFYAVSPMKTKQPTGLTPSITAEKQELTYTVPTTCSEQVDLMYAVTDEYASNDETAEYVTNGITLQFRHALSQIVFKAMTENELIYADIESVSITKLSNYGAFGFTEAEAYRVATEKDGLDFPWSNHSGETTFAASVKEMTNINTQYDETAGTETTTNEGGNYQDGRLTDSSEALLLIPQNLETNGSALEISCKVRYKRGENDIAEIVGSSTEYKTITVPVTTSWEPGYKYTYTLIFTAEMGNPIKVKSVGVDKWNNAAEEEVKVEGEDGNKYAFKGEGTSVNPFEIYTAKDLKRLAELVAEGNEIYQSAYYTQMNDIDLSTECGENLNSGTTWVRIGVSSETFSGVYDGKNYEVQNLYCYHDGYINDADGLFGRNDGTVMNLKVTNCTIDSDYGYIGAVVGRNEGKVINCHTIGGTLKSDQAGLGGVVGLNSSIVLACSNSATINSTAGSVGGVIGNITMIVGENDPINVIACYNTGAISGNGGGVGGVVGQGYGSYDLYSCYNTGNVTNNHNSYKDETGYVLGNQYMTDPFNLDVCYYKCECNGNATDDKSTEVNNTNVTWETALTAMNNKIEEWNKTEGNIQVEYRYVLNDNEETKQTTPLIIVPASEVSNN